MELFPYQLEGVNFLTKRKRALLADDMGLGKTPQAICAAKELGLKKITVVCPSVAKYNWQKEFKRFAGLPAFVYETKEAAPACDIVIASFDAVRLYPERFSRDLDLLIIDEGHFLKSPLAKRTQCVLGKNGLLHKSRYTWALTGTPAPNHAGELWIWLFCFGYTKLSYTQFIGRYCRTINHGPRLGNRVQIMGSNTATTPELKEILKKFSLRRLKSEVLDLPPVSYNIFYVKDDKNFKPPPELKEKLEKELARLEELTGFSVGQELSDDKLLNVLHMMSHSVSSLRRYHALKKVAPAIELISNELREKQYEKILIFGIHSDVLAMVYEGLKEFGACLVTGATPSSERFALQEKFQNDKNLRVFIGNIQAAGTNLTLTASSEVVFIEQDWVPGNNKQASDRSNRYGQTRRVNVRNLCISDSIDEKIVEALTRKLREISTFI